jgi:uncharacterized protein with HEPN domain
MSEAVRHLPDEWLADYPTEPWTQIKGIGNRIRHEYFRLDDAILWEVMTTDAHALKAVMEACSRSTAAVDKTRMGDSRALPAPRGVGRAHG